MFSSVHKFPESALITSRPSDCDHTENTTKTMSGDNHRKSTFHKVATPGGFYGCYRYHLQNVLEKKGVVE
jgi:hypothetical protein